MEKRRLSKKPRVFYGYWIVIAAFFFAFILSVCYYTFSLFVKPLQTDFGWGRGEIMTAWTIFYLVMGVTSAYVGRLIDRHGVRKVVAIGAVIAGLGFVLLTQIKHLWYLYIGYTIIGVGIAAVSQVPASVVVTNWIKKRRGTTLGLMSTGFGAGGFALAPVIGYLIPNFGWRASYLVLAVLTWVLIIPLALFVIKTKPADLGLYPDGVEAPEAAAEAAASPSDSEGLSLKMALATSTFWLIVVSFLTSILGQVGAVQNQAPHLQDVGFPVSMAAGALAGVSLGSIFGKFGFGWLCDRIQPKYVWCIANCFQLAGIIILMSVGPASPLSIIWLYAILMGLGAGGWFPSMSILTSTNFGLIAYGGIFGMITLAQSIGAATGPLIAGLMYDATNTYRWAFIIFLALTAIAIPTILALRRPKSH